MLQLLIGKLSVLVLILLHLLLALLDNLWLLPLLLLEQIAQEGLDHRLIEVRGWLRSWLWLLLEPLEQIGHGLDLLEVLCGLRVLLRSLRPLGVLRLLLENALESVKVLKHLLELEVVLVVRLLWRWRPLLLMVVLLLLLLLEVHR
jgi:hypothetical protein